MRKGCRPVGVSLPYSRAPLGPVYFGLIPGLTVLYGVNGSGKTQLLRLIEDAFGGRPTNYRVNLHLDVGDGSPAASLVFAEMAEDLARRVGGGAPAGTADGMSWPARAANLLRALRVPEDIASDIAQQGEIVLTRVDD